MSYEEIFVVLPKRVHYVTAVMRNIRKAGLKVEENKQDTLYSFKVNGYEARHFDRFTALRNAYLSCPEAKRR